MDKIHCKSCGEISQIASGKRIIRHIRLETIHCDGCGFKHQYNLEISIKNNPRICGKCLNNILDEMVNNYKFEDTLLKV